MEIYYALWKKIEEIRGANNWFASFPRRFKEENKNRGDSRSFEELWEPCYGSLLIYLWFSVTVITYWKQLSSSFFRFIVAFFIFDQFRRIYRLSTTIQGCLLAHIIHANMQYRMLKKNWLPLRDCPILTWYLTKVNQKVFGWF